MFRRKADKKKEEPYNDDSPQPVSDLIGGSGVSLDGESLNIGDDTSLGGTNNGSGTMIRDHFRIIGTVESDEEIPNSPQPFSSPRTPPISPNSSVEIKPPAPHYEKKKYVGNLGDSKDDESGGDYSDDYDDSYDRPYCCCLPPWIAHAPLWLKWIIVLSTALLVGAIVLIGVGATMAIQDVNEAENPPSGPPQQFPVDPPATIPAPTPADDKFKTPAPSSSQISTTDAPTKSPVNGQTQPTVSVPTGGNGSVGRPVTNTSEPTMEPTMAPTSSLISFYVTAGRFTGENLQALPDQLPTLPNPDGQSVLFHLGDWNSPFATGCDENSYQTNDDLYSLSSVPVYFVPGDNEFNDCPLPNQAFGYWHEYFLDFETKYWNQARWNITRQYPDYPENFAYVHNRVLFIGINLVGGVVHDADEWEKRHAANLQWIDDLYNTHYHGDNETDTNIDAMIVLAHADPDIQANDNFFNMFFNRVEMDYADLLTIFVHRNLGVESWGIEPQYENIANLIVVVVQGSIWPPMLIEFDPRGGYFDVDQFEWYYNDTILDGDASVAQAKGIGN